MSPIRPVVLRPLATQSDARLVELSRAGHERAFDVLVRRHRRALLAYAGRLIGAEGRAEDALQQALIQAWLAIREGAEIDDPRAWLYRVVHNTAVTMLRRARLDCVELNEALDAAAPESGPEAQLALSELLRHVAALPDAQRHAIVLTAVQGNSHDEAAAALGLSDGAVRGLVYRARARLREAVAGLLPFGLINVVSRFAGRHSSVGTDTAELAGGASSAGLAAAMLKGGTILAAAGAVAAAGPPSVPQRTHAHRHAAALSRPAVRAPSAAPALTSLATGSPGVAGGARVIEAGAVSEPPTRSGTGHAHRGRDGHSGGGHGSSGGPGGRRGSRDRSGGSADRGSGSDHSGSGSGRAGSGSAGSDGSKGGGGSSHDGSKSGGDTRSGGARRSGGDGGTTATSDGGGGSSHDGSGSTTSPTSATSVTSGDGSGSTSTSTSSSPGGGSGSSGGGDSSRGDSSGGDSSGGGSSGGDSTPATTATTATTPDLGTAP